MPRWIIYVIDLLIVIGAFLLLWFVRASILSIATPLAPDPLLSLKIALSSTDPSPMGQLPFKLTTITIIYALTTFVLKTYHGVVRFSTTTDSYKILQSVATATILYTAVGFVFNISEGLSQYTQFQLWFPFVHGLLVMSLQIIFRLVVRSLYYKLSATDIIPKKTRTFMFGSDTETIQTASAMLSDGDNKFRPVAFIVLNDGISSKTISGLPLLHGKGNLNSYMKSYGARTMLITRKQLNTLPKDFYDQFIVQGLEIYIINQATPIAEESNTKRPPQIDRIKIEDLLGRNVIETDKQAIKKQLEGQVVLITGAAGSIGSEIARQVISFNCKELILVDQAETPLNDLWLELTALKTNVLIKPVVANVTHFERMRQLVENTMPTTIYHAAAYKHVPMMEYHPSTATITNIQGTKNMADLALQYKVKNFVMVSTDKAVNPTNVMGATKRAAETYVQALATSQKGEVVTNFVTTRFGNVLGSNGSVVPLFKRQIEQGGPVTITHREITRYFMTIPEACSLVLEAGSIGNNAEIYIFDMGEAVKIYDLAVKMIRLANKTPHVDIAIVETGLRPGEKLYEELLIDTENTKATHHPKIMIAQVCHKEIEVIAPKIKQLLATANCYNQPDEVVRQLKQLVPEFKSQNSKYEAFDTRQEGEVQREIKQPGIGVQLKEPAVL